MNKLKEFFEIIGALLLMILILSTGDFAEFIDAFLEALP
jgi:hypothetical protein